MKLKYLSAQPANDFFAWQTELYIDNFISRGVPLEDIIVVCSYSTKVPENWVALKEKYPEAGFHFYLDTRVDKTYIPSIQPHILRKHFTKYPELSEYAIFYHDCDFLFTKPFNFSPYIVDGDPKWYFSDCRGYLGAEYIRSKSPELLSYMCYLMGIQESVVIENENNTGGAQKLMKNVTADYWNSVEKSCVKLYKEVDKVKDQYKKENDPYPIQIWCASMWAELWEAWKLGIEVNTPPTFNFAWGTDPIASWVNLSFFHNAGVVDSKDGLFFKGDYQKKLPYGLDLEIKENTCSYMYYNEIKKTELNTVLKQRTF